MVQPTASMRPLHLVVGFSPGSASDTVARTVAPELASVLGQPVEIDRQWGESGLVAARTIMSRPADGHHLMVVTLGTHALMPNADPASYDPTVDFTPVAGLAQAPLILGINAGLPAATVADLVSYGRTSKSVLSFGCSTAIGAPRLAAELFRSLTGIELRIEIYAETRRLYDSLAAGTIDASFNNPMTMLPICETGKARALASTGPARLPAAPTVPTMRECGFGDFVVENWIGVVAPAGLARAEAQRLNAAIRAALGSPAVKRSFAEQGIDAPSDTAEQFGARIAIEVARWAPFARALVDLR